MMGPIDHSNYEAWLLDRLEGTLGPEQERELDAFLAANPGLDTGMDELPDVDVIHARLSPLDKEALKRDLPPAGDPTEPIDDFLIARLEGDLTPAQEDALRQYLADNPHHQRTERSYALTKCIPEAVQYGGTLALKRQLPPVGLPTPYTVQDFLVARLEGDLTPDQERALADLVERDGQAAASWQLLKLTKVAADGVIFPDKSALKKQPKVIAIGAALAAWAVHLRVAATVAVLLSFGVWALLKGPNTSTQVANIPSPTHPAPEQGAPAGEPDAAAAGDGSARVQEHPVQARPFTPVRDQLLAEAKPAAAGDDLNNDPVRDGEQTAPLAPLEVLLAHDAPQRAQPLEKPLPERPIELWEEEDATLVAMRSASNERTGIPLGAFLANALRKRVLDAPADEPRPLGPDDALAAVDKGLRNLGGEQAGLEVQRASDGRLRSFDLRLSRNLAISAGR